MGSSTGGAATVEAASAAAEAANVAAHSARDAATIDRFGLGVIPSRGNRSAIPMQNGTYALYAPSLRRLAPYF
jgi:hypothetical protein